MLHADHEEAILNSVASYKILDNSKSAATLRNNTAGANSTTTFNQLAANGLQAYTRGAS